MTWTIFLPSYLISNPPDWIRSNLSNLIRNPDQILMSFSITLLKATVSCLDYYSSLARLVESPWSAEDIKARVIRSHQSFAQQTTMPACFTSRKCQVPYNSLRGLTSPGALPVFFFSILVIYWPCWPSRLPFQVLLAAVSSARNSFPMDISMAKPFTSFKFLLR